jgi:hypothetical protein
VKKLAERTAAAEKRDAKGARKAARKAARQAVRETPPVEVPHPPADAARVAQVVDGAAPAGPAATARRGARATDGSARARKVVGRAGSVGASAAGSVLREVAGLVRQATEPAAARIVGRVGQRSATGSTAEPAPPSGVLAAIPGAAADVHAVDVASDVAEPAAIEPDGVDAAPEAKPEPEPAVGAPEAIEMGPEPEPEPVGPAPESIDMGPEPEPAVGAIEIGPEPEPEPVGPAPGALEIGLERDPAVGAPEPEPEPVEPEAETIEIGPEPQPQAIDIGAERPEPFVEPVVATAPRVTASPAPPSQPPAVTPLRDTIFLRDVPPGAVVGASIDVGSNSVHLLVGIVDGHRVDPVVDESVFLGLGDKVSTDGFLGGELLRALVADLARYVAIAKGLGAATVTIVGTEPLRRADDAATAVHEVTRRIGVPLHVLGHDEEGLLTLLGVTGGLPIDGELLVVDIGGGSSELVSVTASGAIHATGLQVGSARLTRSLARSDPPSLADLEAMRVEVARIVATAPAGLPTDIVAVGGTSSNLLRLLPATTIDRALTRRRIAVALAMLTVERSREAAVRHGLRPERARVLPAGAIIVDALLEHYGADRLRVSEEGIREGAILAAAAAGASWRDRLRTLAAGWEDPAPVG